MMTPRTESAPKREAKIARHPSSRCTSHNKIGTDTQERINTTWVSA